MGAGAGTAGGGDGQAPPVKYQSEPIVESRTRERSKPRALDTIPESSTSTSSSRREAQRSSGAEDYRLPPRKAKVKSIETRHYAGSTLSETPGWDDILEGPSAWDAAADAIPLALTGAKLAAVGGGGWDVALFCGGAIQWLSEYATPVYHSIMRWWGGAKEWERVWGDYKKARRAIIKQNKDNDTRLKLLQDLRSEFREKQPHWADRFN
jgi:hypothetical protein